MLDDPSPGRSWRFAFPINSEHGKRQPSRRCLFNRKLGEPPFGNIPCHGVQGHAPKSQATDKEGVFRKEVRQAPGGRRHHADVAAFRERGSIRQDKLHMPRQLLFRDDATVGCKRMARCSHHHQFDIEQALLDQTIRHDVLTRGFDRDEPSQIADITLRTSSRHSLPDLPATEQSQVGAPQAAASPFRPFENRSRNLVSLKKYANVGRNHYEDAFAPRDGNNLFCCPVAYRKRAIGL